MKKKVMLKSGLIMGFIISLLTVLSGCIPQEEGGEGGFNWTIIIFLGLMFAVFYFFMIRPQRKRQKEHQEMIQEMKRGDKAVTAGGIYGVVDTISEDSVVLKVESGAMIRVDKSYVSIRKDESIPMAPR
ncbi:preprotein translocase subunit YajC [Chloroflexota bacterium]